jgi:hypothetical protein
MTQVARRASLVALLLLASVGTASAQSQQATVGLAFHQAVTASQGLADPGRFERMERPAGEADVYVARTAALVIHPDEITAVVVTREPVYADTASITESFRRRLGLPGQPQPMRIAGHVYLATMHVDTQAAQRVHTFTAKHVGQRVDVRFNGTRLGVPKILGPASSEFGISLDGWTRAQIEQVFAVLRARLTWPVDER